MFPFLSPFKTKTLSQALVIGEGLAISKLKPSQSKGREAKNTEKSVSLKTTEWLHFSQMEHHLNIYNIYYIYEREI